MMNVDELLAGLDDLWGGDSEKENKTPDNRVSSEGEIIGTSATDAAPAGTTSHVGLFEQPDAEQAFVDALSDVIVPKAKPQKEANAHKQIVVIDDDFSTLDLMKIYLQREYDYLPFDNAREAIFHLNKKIPDLIFLDCYISLIKAKRLVEIIRSYPEYDVVPIYLLAEADEKGAMEAKISNHDFEGVAGILTRPVARGELQNILDMVFPKDEPSGETT